MYEDMKKDMIDFTVGIASQFSNNEKRDVPAKMLRPDYRFEAAMAHCGDDRANDEIVSPIPLFGGFLGAVNVPAMQGVYDLARSPSWPSSFKIELPKLEQHIEALAGIPTFHTAQTQKEAHDPLQCAGCGHLAGILSDPEKYFVNPEIVSFLKEHLLADLVTRGANPAVYPGEHDADGLIVIQSREITLPPRSKDGQIQVYTHHEAWHSEAIRQVAKHLRNGYLSPIRDFFTEEDVNTALWAAAQKQLTPTAKKLVGAKPQYSAFLADNGNVRVALIA